MYPPRKPEANGMHASIRKGVPTTRSRNMALIFVPSGALSGGR
jgi:hypothetical protein